MNFWLGKLIFGLLGYWIAGITGLLLGCIIGHAIDKIAYQATDFSPKTHSRLSRARIAFFQTTFRVMGFIAKADGMISTNEIKVAEQIMARLSLNRQQRQEAITLFTQGKQPNFNLTQQLDYFIYHCGNQFGFIQTFYEIQLQAAYADGHISAAKQYAMRQICERLGLEPIFTNRSSYRERENSYHQQPPPQRQVQRSKLNDAYILLGITKTAPDSEVKRAYRKLMSKNHPDKLIAKGLSDAMLRSATEKTQLIKAAYDLICAERGI